eukprot:CAMPEP_0172580210 /NCGR_PEP_ID=MMETSP1067-20121228/139642_1 /TAXON_ID=265564 ORGANISM="Thalassiosira punctigera, Strain Tpunct2005C2" /NCGR_SAMPLE_ID=MMETSP1067 /ASSEMBLY_ACC=CAM_ASM_000444 /LENGTH=112 /DNA_ID=CAMNT_0013372947 /DNA_START=1132 /DNA_END=1470 /DNA_ORIENTATION=-
MEGYGVGLGDMVGVADGRVLMLQPSKSIQQYMSSPGHSSLLPDGQCRSRLQLFLASKTVSPQKLDLPSGRPRSTYSVGLGEIVGLCVGGGVGVLVGSPRMMPSTLASHFVSK